MVWVTKSDVNPMYIRKNVLFIFYFFTFDNKKNLTCENFDNKKFKKGI
jgi:hypothetical protein